MLEFQSVSITFHSQKVLDAVSFSVNENEKLMIVGKSGAGKSVLIKLLTGLLKPDAGKIFIEGKDTQSFNQNEWNKTLNNFGFVFQGGALFDSLNIAENVGLKLQEDGLLSAGKIHAKVLDALAKVGLNANILPKMPADLSGGMKKRVAIARAIIHQPKYLIYDEPTTGLDPQNAGMIDELIRDLAGQPGITSMVVTHDLETIRAIPGKVLLLSEGKIAFLGETQSFFASTKPEILQFLGRSLASQT